MELKTLPHLLEAFFRRYIIISEVDGLRKPIAGKRSKKFLQEYRVSRKANMTGSVWNLCEVPEHERDTLVIGEGIFLPDGYRFYSRRPQILISVLKIDTPFQFKFYLNFGHKSWE